MQRELANVLLDQVDKELGRRGHCFVPGPRRDLFVALADDASVYVRSRRAGARVMALLRRLYGELKLTVNEAKSARWPVCSAASSWATAYG